MKRLFSLSLATLAFSVSFAMIGCGGGGDPAPLERTEEDVQIEEEAASGMEDAMKGMQ